MATANTIQIVPDEETELAEAEAQGEMMGDRIKMAAEFGVVPLAAYAATRQELPLIARIGLGAVALVKAGPYFSKIKRWYSKY